MQCVTNEEMRRLLTDNISAEEKLRLMEHICQCGKCSELLCEVTEELAQIEPVPGFQEQTLFAAHLNDRPKETLMQYSVRVIASVCAALIILFSCPLTKLTDFDIVKSSHALAENVTSGIRDLLNLEVTGNE